MTSKAVCRRVYAQVEMITDAAISRGIISVGRKGEVSDSFK